MSTATLATRPKMPSCRSAIGRWPGLTREVGVDADAGEQAGQRAGPGGAWPVESGEHQGEDLCHATVGGEQELDHRGLDVRGHRRSTRPSHAQGDHQPADRESLQCARLVILQPAGQ